MMTVTVMPRRLIALTAAYAMVLQAALGFFALAESPGSPQICASVGHVPAPDPPLRGSDCAACPAMCSGAGSGGIGIVPSASAVAALPALSFGIGRSIVAVTSRPADRRLPPSRAPPAA
jgi:hypothetical protein